MTYSDARLAALRENEQHTRWYLGIYSPPTVLACRLDNADIAKGDLILAYDGVTSGAWGNVEQDMMMYIGSALGKADYGRVRVETIDASEIEVEENDHIEWADDLYLTIVRFWEPRAIYPRQIYDEDTDTVYWYKRYDLAYTDQNLYPPPVPCMGGHFAGFVDHPSGVFFDGAESYDVMEDALSFAWAFPSGTPGSSAAESPGYIQYGESGYYTAKLTLSNSQGKSYAGYRHVMLFDRPGEGPNRPFTDVEFAAEVVGSRDLAGFEVEFRVNTAAEDVDIANIRDGALCIIFAEEWFGTTKQSYGQHQGREHIVYAGYLVGDTLTKSVDASLVSFRTASVTRVLDNRDMFPVALDYTSAGPLDWYQMYEMNVDRAVHHYLLWHSTLYRCADVARTGDSRLLQFATFSRQSCLSAVRKFLQGTLFADICADAQGWIHAEIDGSMVIPATRTKVMLFRILGTDWRDQLTIPRFWERKASQVELGGVHFYGPNVETDFEALLSVAPGDAPAYAGSSQTATGFVVSSQSDLNELSGLRLAQLNNKQARLSIPMSGNYRCVPLAPQERLRFDVTPDWDPQSNSWNGLPYFVDQVRHMLTRGRCMTVLTVSAETEGPAGETIIIPEVPPWEPVEIPPPPEAPPPPGPEEGTGLGTVYVLTETQLGRTRRFSKLGGANWLSVKGVLTGTMYEFLLDPWDPVNGAYVFTYDVGNKGGTGIWYCSDLNSVVPTFTLKYTITQIETVLGGALNASRIKMVGSINEEGYVGLCCTQSNGVYYFHTHDRWSTVASVLVHNSSIDTDYSGTGMDLVPHHVDGNIWVYICYKGGWDVCSGANGRVEISKDGGHTFSVCAAGCITDYSDQTKSVWGPLTCPYEGNEDGQTFYLVTCPPDRADQGQVYKSTDEGATLSVHKPGTAGPALFHRISIESHTFDKNRVFHWDSANKLWMSNNGMDSWIYIGDGDDDFGFAGDVVASGGFPYNDQLFYALAGGIYFSLTRGTLWRDATGDWVAVLGAFGTGQVIVPVWTE